MLTAPALNSHAPAGPIEPRYVLLINPFYAKDANASFGKHVLTPTLALTSFAATTPTNWRLKYWDENLLAGSPPCDPTPEVVAITVHLTFAGRAYELADWYRACGSKVILGGLHVLSCPGEGAPHADALHWEMVFSPGHKFCATSKLAAFKTKTTIATILRRAVRFFRARAS